MGLIVTVQSVCTTVGHTDSAVLKHVATNIENVSGIAFKVSNCPPYMHHELILHGKWCGILHEFDVSSQPEVRWCDVRQPSENAPNSSTTHMGRGGKALPGPLSLSGAKYVELSYSVIEISSREVSPGSKVECYNEGSDRLKSGCLSLDGDLVDTSVYDSDLVCESCKLVSADCKCQQHSDVVCLSSEFPEDLLLEYWEDVPLGAHEVLCLQQDVAPPHFAIDVYWKLDVHSQNQ
ncbi:hypothetical protein PR048_032774 [Dryococelus australis]|uniref:Uncharacterized protein n=1 Tax=Dryococelus australis TaxID=614101 RepID=A0ABQ9G4B6_9NEOP|nr:hypothetical protein PR048_032774 [Dryococelus australis]